MSSPKIERRALATADMPEAVGVEERADGKLRFRGVAAVYNRKSQDLGGFREVIAPGAFDSILNRKYKRADVIACWNHDPSSLLGRTASGTLRLTSTDRGLEYEVDPPETTLARDLAVLVRRGDVFGSSFAFTFDPADADEEEIDGETVRTIRSVTGLFDVSLVTNPAYLDTVAAYRSLDEMRSALSPEPESAIPLVEPVLARSPDRGVSARAAVQVARAYR